MELDMLGFVNIIHDLYGDRFKLPKSNNPKWLISLIGFMFGLTRKYVKNNVGHALVLDSSKSREKLGLGYIPLEKTMKDMIEQLLSEK